MAKFYKGGEAIEYRKHAGTHKASEARVIAKPSLRDQRKFSDVLKGQTQTTPKVEEKGNIFPISFTLNVVENPDISKMLVNAIIVENLDVIDPNE